MEYKTYYAKDLSIVLDQVKQELGSDAIIIKSRRTRKKGFLGLFQKPVYEVVVSYDPDELPSTTPEVKLPRDDGEKSPLRGFGKAMEQRVYASAQAALNPKPATAIAPEKKAAPAPVVQHEAELPAVGPQEFAELIKMADYYANVGEDATAAAWNSPSAKVGAYVSMQKGAMLTDDDEDDEPLSEPLVAQVEPFSGTRAQYPSRMDDETEPAAKRKRGRPRKYPLPAEEEEEAEYIDEPAIQIVSRLDVVEQMLRSLTEQMKRTNGAAAPEEAEADEDILDAEAQAEQIKMHLLNQDVDIPVADALIKAACEYRDVSGMRLETALGHALTQVLGKPRYLRGSTKTARTVMLIGPTGVGKTTTLVKLAAGCIFERKARVAIINADVFRVGAQDQLKAYAKILDVPLSTIYDTSELKKTITEYADMDFIFIDTCGKASNDQDYQNEIKQLLKSGQVQDVYLVVSSTTSGRLCRQIVESYAFIKQYKTILTKLDESGSVGSAVNLCYYSGQPLAYVTIGQNVPDDISKADVDTVVAQLLR